MRILVTNHWLKKIGGSETFTYTLVGELLRKQCKVELYTLVPGQVSSRISQDFGVLVHTNAATIKKQDLVLANHKTCVTELAKAGIGPIIQTCHGTLPKLEQPAAGADYYVAISEEVKKHIKSMGYPVDAVIHNGVDLQRFSIKTPLNERPRFALSLAHSEQANAVLANACAQFRIKLLVHNKHRNARWDIENVINQADIVFTLGRGVYESLACGRNVIIFDKRPYQEGMGDGMVTPTNLAAFLQNNCSGRTRRLPFTVENVINEIWKYQSDPAVNRAMAVQYFDIVDAVEKYIDLWNQ